jgi:hypothetical protein
MHQLSHEELRAMNIANIGDRPSEAAITTALTND